MLLLYEFFVFLSLLLTMGSLLDGCCGRREEGGQVAFGGE